MTSTVELSYNGNSKTARSSAVGLVRSEKNMQKYFGICVAMFAVGLIMLVIGALMKDRLKPKVAAVLILIGALTAMVFMNMSLVLYMMMLNR